MIAQTIGWCSASISLLCLVGLFTVRVMWPAPAGQHAKRAKHRDTGQGHEGAGSPGHVEELEQLVEAVHAFRDKRDRIGGA